MSAISPPPSPQKRNMLRTIVTGVTPTDDHTHHQRWSRTCSAGPPSPTKAGMPLGSAQPAATGGMAGAAGTGGKVAGLVQGWEASLSGSSRPYSALPPVSPSPWTAARPSSTSPTLQTTPDAGQSRFAPPSSSSPSTSRGPSPTVPASFFQAQQAKRVPPSTASKPYPTYERSAGKENEPSPRSSFQPASRPSSSLPPANGSLSAATSVSQVTNALTDLTVDTMATRSSDSTHASSLATNSAEGAYVGVAARIPVSAVPTTRQQMTQPRAGTPTRSGPAGLRAPRIVETAPTPLRNLREEAPAPFSQLAARPVFGASAQPRPAHTDHANPPASIPFHLPSPPIQTSFFEHLPPSRSPEPRPLLQEGALPSPTLQTSRYSPLPLDHSPVLQQPEAPQTQQTKSRGRPRASSLGAGLKAAFDEGGSPRVETAEEKRARVQVDFEKLLDTMQLPDRTVRTKMLGLAFPLKEEMLRSAVNPLNQSTSSLRPATRPKHQRGRSLNLADSQPPSAAPQPAKKEGGSGFRSAFLRKSKSNNTLREEAAKEAASALSVSTSASGGETKGRPRSHSRTASAASAIFRSFGKSSGAGAAAAVASAIDTEDATYWAVRLRSTKCSSLDVKELGRLRGRLRTEAPIWVNEFIKSEGYLGMLERLKELLDMEWREEQHDDQILHEILRCFKALTMTACGKRALASHSPTPFLPIASLLFSEKRPGDLPCRQLLVELILSLLEICPIKADTLPKDAWATPEISLDPAPSSPSSASGFGSSSDGGSGGLRRYTRKMKSGDDEEGDAAIEREEVLTPERIQQTHRFVVSLMEGPPDEKEEAKVDFVKVAVRPRVFKTWVTEISDCVRDYFWIFCHANNLFWTLEQIDAEAIEAPKVPSGMTGGVEYEAMAYCASHFRLINAIARTCPTIEAAFAFHNQLFESGFERVLFTLRRASLVYYQTLHLEMSRYISLARSARFNLGARILGCLDRRFLSRQELMVLEQVERATFQSRSGAPQLAAPF
ncbi:hypothetical protein JCM11641_002653 [Rhodosporidiobolus odoratus]